MHAFHGRWQLCASESNTFSPQGQTAETQESSRNITGQDNEKSQYIKIYKAISVQLYSCDNITQHDFQAPQPLTCSIPILLRKPANSPSQQRTELEAADRASPPFWKSLTPPPSCPATSSVTSQRMRPTNQMRKALQVQSKYFF